MDRLFKLVKSVKELEENKEFIRITAERQSSGGVLSAIFGDRAAALSLDSQRADHSLVGSIVIEKITPNPPGSAVASVTSQLLDADSITEKLALKVSVCDKGSYAVKVAEPEF
jgi:hypothetical protein